MFDVPVLLPRVLCPTPVELDPAFLPDLYPTATISIPVVTQQPAWYPIAVFAAAVLVPKLVAPIPIDCT